MNFAVQLEQDTDTPPDVVYRWDRDTDILSARLRTDAVAEGIAGAVEVAGDDGSWLILDVSAGRIRGVEVAVWPDVRKVPTLAPPHEVEYARVSVPSKGKRTGEQSLEVDTALIAEADESERTIHFRLGPSRQTRTVRLARDLLLDIDGHGAIAGVWLLNVPPFPAQV